MHVHPSPRSGRAGTLDAVFFSFVLSKLSGCEANTRRRGLYLGLTQRIKFEAVGGREKMFLVAMFSLSVCRPGISCLFFFF